MKRVGQADFWEYLSTFKNYSAVTYYSKKYGNKDYCYVVDENVSEIPVLVGYIDYTNPLYEFYIADTSRKYFGQSKPYMQPYIED